jgi:hypothetical protein
MGTGLRRSGRRGLESASQAGLSRAAVGIRRVRRTTTGTRMNKLFVRFANAVAEGSGYPSVFAVAILTVAVWLASGPVFRFSDTWRLVMNTLTSVITFLMVFLIRTSQPVQHLAVGDVRGLAELVAGLTGRCGKATLAAQVTLVEPRLLLGRSLEGLDPPPLSGRSLCGFQRGAQPAGKTGLVPSIRAAVRPLRKSMVSGLWLSPSLWLMSSMPSF